MRVIGLDLSLTETGWAWNAIGSPGTTFEPESGVFTAKNMKAGARLLWYWRCIERIGRPHVWLIEDLPTHAKSAGLTGQLHGAVKALAVEAEWPEPILVTAASLKTFATGRGNADKIAMVVAARDRLGYEGENDNEADAIWLCELGMRIAGMPTIKLPQTHLRALDKIVVPL